MPQFDKRRRVDVPVEYETYETLIRLPVPGRVSIVLVTDGKANIILNGKAVTVFSPCVMCLSEQDLLEVIYNNRMFAQSFSLSPAFIKNRQSFRQIKIGADIQGEQQYTEDILALFLCRTENYNGILILPPQSYLRIFEWFCVIGTEIWSQSDGRWTCRIRSYFMMILDMLEETYTGQDFLPYTKPKDSPVDTVMEYIHTHYMEEITLDKLCRLAKTNRTTLSSRYKQRTGQSVIEYLTNYRMRIATELLAHTGLTIDEIARQTGFGYDTYLIRRFREKTGKTPTEYRKDTRGRNNIVIFKE